MFILAAAAGLFAGSYCYAMANPTPHHIPTAVVGSSPEGTRLVRGLEDSLDTSLRVRHYDTYAQAYRQVELQHEFAVLQLFGDHARLDVAGAAGASVARVLSEAGPPVGAAVGVPLTVRDVKPLQPSDPQGLALFYISLAAVIIGFVGAIQLSVHARALKPGERIAFTVAYALLGGFTICAVVDWMLGVLDLPFLESWIGLALTMFTAGMVFSMFSALFQRWAMIPTWGLLVLLGNPSSGGAVATPLLPSGLAWIGRFLPPGACVNLQRNAIYFNNHQHIEPWVVLITWAAISTLVFLLWRHLHPVVREKARLIVRRPSGTDTRAAAPAE